MPLIILELEDAMEPVYSEEEMRRNYPHFRAFVYAKLIEQFSKELEPIEGDLEKIAQEEGALPLEAFIKEIENGEP